MSQDNVIQGSILDNIGKTLASNPRYNHQITAGIKKEAIFAKREIRAKQQYDSYFQLKAIIPCSSPVIATTHNNPFFDHDTSTLSFLIHRALESATTPIIAQITYIALCEGRVWHEWSQDAGCRKCVDETGGFSETIFCPTNISPPSNSGNSR